MDYKREAEILEEYIGLYQEYKPHMDNLCDRAKETLFTAFSSYYLDEIINGKMIPTESMSPIEQMFLIAYVALVNRDSRRISFRKGEIDYDNAPITLLNEYLIPQEIVEVDGKKYKIDFSFRLDKWFDGCQLKFAVELDGFEYHSKKKQMDSDYERERALIKAGYRVIRFTGSQVYKNPFSCAAELINIMLGESIDYYKIVG